MRTGICFLFTAVLAATIASPAPAAEPGTRPAPQRPPPGPGGGMMLDRMHDAVGQFKLTDEQKSKIDSILKQARQDLQALRSNLQSLEPRERMDRVREFLQGVREKVGDVLSAEQKAELEQKLEQARQNFRGATTRPGGPGGPSGPGGPGMLGDRIRQNLAKLDLSDEQKARIKEILDDTRTKAQELREQVQSGAAEARDKMRQLMQDTREKVGDILTKDQREKFRELMDAGGPPGPPPRQRNRDNPTTEKSEAGPKNTTVNSGAAGPSPGDQAPQLALKKLDGSSLQLSSLMGRVVVLEFGSYSCPSFRTRAAAMEKLKNDYGPKAQFFIVYTREAHADGEWEVDRNKDDGISVQQPKTLDARRDLAGTAREKLRITVPIALDSIDNSAATAFGAGANSAYVIDRDGCLAARQDWFEPTSLRHSIDQAVAARPTTQP